MVRKQLTGSNIPKDLCERDQWVLWRRERNTKVPYRVDGRQASTTRPTDWSGYEGVMTVLARNPERYAGIGFVFSGSDPLVGIDLDDCLEVVDGPTKSVIRPMIERFSDTYMEVSPSGTGLKIWCKGILPAPIRVFLNDGIGLEMYDRARYFTVTGRVFNGAPLQIEDHAMDVSRLHEHLRRNRPNQFSPPYEISSNIKIPMGSRHLTLVSLAGTLRRRGVCDRAVEACLLAVNRFQCEQPKPVHEIAQIVSSSKRWRCV
jgi:primase-polymerase (primpol)-like protein